MRMPAGCVTRFVSPGTSIWVPSIHRPCIVFIGRWPFLMLLILMRFIPMVFTMLAMQVGHPNFVILEWPVTLHRFVSVLLRLRGSITDVNRE